MAITIVQQPTSPNAAYTRLPYLISGSTAVTSSQFQYVMDIYESGSSDLISRVTQTVNPEGVAVFDPSKILQGELDYDLNWKATLPTNSPLSAKTFDIKFGEQYGTSPSSSVTVYPDQTSDSILVFPATHDLNLQDNPNLSGSFYDVADSGWNFPAINFAPSTDARLFADDLLTNNPYNQVIERNTFFEPTASAAYNLQAPLILGREDYHTVSNLATNGYNEAYIIIQLFSGSNSIYSTSTYSTRTTVGPGVSTYGVGPANLRDLDSNFETYLTGSTWTNYIINAYIFNGSAGNVNYINVVNEEIDLSTVPTLYGPTTLYRSLRLPQPVDTCRDKVRFAWINNFGYWDYYNVYNPVRRSSDIQRENVTLSQLDYSGTDTTYNLNRRGQKDYYVDTTDRFSVTTDYISKPEAQWLEELLESPQVYIQKGGCFIPVVITNNSYQHNNETSRNKLFQYTIEFEPANQPYGDWNSIPEGCQRISPTFYSYDWSLIVTSSVDLEDGGLEYAQEGGGTPAILTSFTNRTPGTYVNIGTFTSTLSGDIIDWTADVDVTASYVPYSFTANFYSSGSLVSQAFDSGSDLNAVGAIVSQTTSSYDEVIFNYNIENPVPPGYANVDFILTVTGSGINPPFSFWSGSGFTTSQYDAPTGNPVGTSQTISLDSVTSTDWALSGSRALLTGSSINFSSKLDLWTYDGSVSPSDVFDVTWNVYTDDILTYTTTSTKTTSEFNSTTSYSSPVFQTWSITKLKHEFILDRISTGSAPTPSPTPSPTPAPTPPPPTDNVFIEGNYGVTGYQNVQYSAGFALEGMTSTKTLYAGPSTTCLTGCESSGVASWVSGASGSVTVQRLAPDSTADDAGSLSLNTVSGSATISTPNPEVFSNGDTINYTWNLTNVSSDAVLKVTIFEG